MRVLCGGGGGCDGFCAGWAKEVRVSWMFLIVSSP